MDAFERVCTRPQEWQTSEEIEIMAADVGIKLNQMYVKCNITDMATVESSAEEYEFMSQMSVLDWVLYFPSRFKTNFVELSSKKFRDKFNTTFPLHFKLESRDLFYQHYVYKHFLFVNGYLAISNERIGGNYLNVNLFDRIGEFYPEW